MKTLMMNPMLSPTLTLTETAGRRSFFGHPSGKPSPNTPFLTGATYPSLESVLRQPSVLTAEAQAEMAQGSLPDLGRICQDLFATFFKPGAPYSALQFIPVLKALDGLDRAEARRFMKNPATRHVLVQNDLLKVVLIHWKPGEFSGIHGHPKGGCVFKVLRGSLEERRYSPDAAQQLLAVSSFQRGGMAYIDDNMAYHAVGNPNDVSAISLHVYTPGKR